MVWWELSATTDLCLLFSNLAGSLYSRFLLASKAPPVPFVYLFFMTNLEGQLRKPSLVAKKQAFFLGGKDSIQTLPADKKVKDSIYIPYVSLTEELKKSKVS